VGCRLVCALARFVIFLVVNDVEMLNVNQLLVDVLFASKCITHQY
jgi:hypothetical protein